MAKGISLRRWLINFLIVSAVAVCSWFFMIPAQAKVYDCFMFFNEIELLKMRLEELDPVVDYFVLVESAETQRGGEKPFYFRENQHLFEKYLHKIIHIAVDERHPELDLWARENYQRNCIARGLTKCRANDVIIISDLDEIPNAELIGQIKKNPRGILTEPLALNMDIYFFHLNRQRILGELWVGTVITQYKAVKRKGVQYFRDKRGSFQKKDHAGWHFTWMGGRDKIRQKHQSVVEGNTTGHLHTDEEIDRWVQESHPFLLPVDASFPKYIQNNARYLHEIGYLAE